jgi:hypothetical protein
MDQVIRNTKQELLERELEGAELGVDDIFYRRSLPETFEYWGPTPTDDNLTRLAIGDPEDYVTLVEFISSIQSDFDLAKDTPRVAELDENLFLMRFTTDAVIYYSLTPMAFDREGVSIDFLEPIKFTQTY